jgi:hypothetical protein
MAPPKILRVLYPIRFFIVEPPYDSAQKTSVSERDEIPENGAAVKGQAGYIFMTC